MTIDDITVTKYFRNRYNQRIKDLSCLPAHKQVDLIIDHILKAEQIAPVELLLIRQTKRHCLALEDKQGAIHLIDRPRSAVFVIQQGASKHWYTRTCYIAPYLRLLEEEPKSSPEQKPKTLADRTLEIIQEGKCQQCAEERRWAVALCWLAKNGYTTKATTKSGSVELEWQLEQVKTGLWPTHRPKGTNQKWEVPLKIDRYLVFDGHSSIKFSELYA